MPISRVSTYQLNKSFANQINSTQSKYNELAKQIQSGVKVSSMSDDPVSANGIIKANKQLDNIETYLSNIKTAGIELSQVDTTLKGISDKLSEAYDLAMQVSNGTMGEDELKAYQSKLDSIIENVTKLADTNYNGQYLFSGTRTTTSPYEKSEEGLKYGGNSENRYAIIGDNKTQAINFIGKDIFGEASFTTDANGNITFDAANSSGAFSGLYQLKAAIQNGKNIDEDAVKSAMTTLNSSIDTVVGAQTRAGAAAENFDDMLSTYENDQLNLKELRSNLQDTDLPSAISDWYSAYQSMQASYSMLAQTMNVSLLNYI